MVEFLLFFNSLLFLFLNPWMHLICLMYELLGKIDKSQVFLFHQRVKIVHSVCNECMTESVLNLKLRKNSETNMHPRSALTSASS